MLANVKLPAAVYIAILATAVNAQTSSAPPASATPACVAACIQSSLSPNGCTSATNLACVCTNPTFVNAATKCIQSNCTSAERTEALQLQVAECAALNSTSTATATSAAASPTESNSSINMGIVQFVYKGLIGATVGLVVGAGLLF
ncbi:hypothetical protein PILCRDRAFT_824387 [Piloderma croceum F 1598]|uniref:CFEM domain-containing protein n=1 Tax=Piloderma croceum (strain F 1598) TaxID=765440 RepID=A0A0C3F116_PILCF|nr:hypothetical protein PILCRDRAFT_824387 [Piloderma croceum F 1598]